MDLYNLLAKILLLRFYELQVITFLVIYPLNHFHQLQVTQYFQNLHFQFLISTLTNPKPQLHYLL